MTPERPPAPDYTAPFLASLFVVLLIALLAIWALWGLFACCAAGWGADRLIARGARRG